MKSQVKKVDSTKREIQIEIEGEQVKNKFADVFGRIAKEAKVAGFRPGHAPRDIIEKNFSSSAHEQVLKELVPDVYHEALRKEGLDVIELPEITDVKLDRDRLSFKATVEVRPEIPVKNYRGEKINYQKISVTPDEVKRNIDAIKESRKIETIDDNFARSLGYPDLSELEKAIERQVFLQKENHQRQRIESEIVENLLKDLDFTLPPSLLKRQLEDLLRQTKLDLALKGVPREKIDAEENNLVKDLQPEAERQVRVYLVLAEIAKRENITLDDHMPRKVMEFLLKEADWKEAG